MRIMRSLWMGLVTISLLGMASCAKPKALVYQEVKHFKVANANFQQVTLGLDLQFYNPNNFAVSLKDGDLNAYFNDRYVGKATVAERTSVPKLDTFLLPVTVAVDLKQLFPNVLDIATSRDMLVRLDGSVKMGKGGVFIPVPIHYEGRQKAKF